MTKKTAKPEGQSYVYQIVLAKRGTTEVFSMHYGVAASAQAAVDAAIARHKGTVELHAKQVVLLGEKAF